MSSIRSGIEAALLGGLLLAATACTRVDTDRFSGYAEADLVYVAPAIGGRLQSLGVERGARVKPGQMPGMTGLSRRRVRGRHRKVVQLRLSRL